MFTAPMTDTWIAATIVAFIAGVVGFFAVLRGSAFAAHAIPNGAFAGAAAAGLIGLNPILGLATFAIGGSLAIASTRRGRPDVVTALALVMMLGLGALFLALSGQYASELYALLFGEVFGVPGGDLLPIAGLGLLTIVAVALLFRPLLLSSAMPEVAEARGVKSRWMNVAFLLVMALATSLTVPVVGTLLMFSLMIGPAAAARSFTSRPLLAMAMSVALALLIVWAGIAISYESGWPLGFFVGMGGAVIYMAARVWSSQRRSPRPGGPGPAQQGPSSPAEASADHHMC
jgi:zinc/manganese transport system permease protein